MKTCSKCKKKVRRVYKHMGGKMCIDCIPWGHSNKQHTAKPEPNSMEEVAAMMGLATAPDNADQDDWRKDR